MYQKLNSSITTDSATAFAEKELPGSQQPQDHGIISISTSLRYQVSQSQCSASKKMDEKSM